MSDLATAVDEVPTETVDGLLEDYEHLYELEAWLGPGGAPPIPPGGCSNRGGLRSILSSGGFAAFTDTFEDSRSPQLPGLPVQRSC